MDAALPGHHGGHELTGFGFPVDHLLPSHVVGALSLTVLAVAILARYFHLRGAWRWIYVVCAALALYFNVFVGVVQAFLNIPVLNALAPQQTEPPFLVISRSCWRCSSRSPSSRRADSTANRSPGGRGAYD